MRLLPTIVLAILPVALALPLQARNDFPTIDDPEAFREAIRKQVVGKPNDDPAPGPPTPPAPPASPLSGLPIFGQLVPGLLGGLGGGLPIAKRAAEMIERQVEAVTNLLSGLPLLSSLLGGGLPIAKREAGVYARQLELLAPVTGALSGAGGAGGLTNVLSPLLKGGIPAK